MCISGQYSFLLEEKASCIKERRKNQWNEIKHKMKSCKPQFRTLIIMLDILQNKTSLFFSYQNLLFHSQLSFGPTGMLQNETQIN